MATKLLNYMVPISTSVQQQSQKVTNDHNQWPVVALPAKGRSLYTSSVKMSSLKSCLLKQICFTYFSLITKKQKLYTSESDLSQLMTSWYLSYRRPLKTQMSLRICAVSPESSLFTHMKYGSKRRVGPNIRHLAPLDGWACTFEERVYG